MKDLTDIRKEIDSVDDQITALFQKRMDIVKEVAESKKGTGKAINDIERENAVLYRLAGKVDDDIKFYLKELYSTIFYTSKAYQSTIMGATAPTIEKLRDLTSVEFPDLPVVASVACQGVKGAYSGTAAKKVFAISDVTYFKTFEGVFTAVDKGLCEFGILPIENSTAGSVLDVYDLMRKHNFHIVRSARVRVDHALAGVSGATLKDIKTVISHPQALSQCAEYIKKLGVNTIVAENTALAAKQVAEQGDKSVAALCSPDCASIYGLDMIEKGVQDSPNNYTRFICIAKDLKVYKGADRISVMTSLSHEPGSLNRILSRFSALGLNLTKIESRPIANADFEFMFYFDFEGDIRDKAVENAIAELENGSDKFVFLGSYKEIL